MRIEPLLVLSLLAACGEPDGPQSTAPLAACVYDFTADVREGPDAPLHIEGKVTLAMYDDGALAGELEQGDTFTPVAGRLADGRIELRFDLGDGKAINGMGPFAGDYEDCGGDLVGDLAGPVEGDAGDWLAYPVDYLDQLCTVNVCAYRPRTRNECTLYCGIGKALSGAAYETCVSDCRAGQEQYQFYQCGPADGGAQGPGVSQFFPPMMSNEC